MHCFCTASCWSPLGDLSGESGTGPRAIYKLSQHMARSSGLMCFNYLINFYFLKTKDFNEAERTALGVYPALPPSIQSPVSYYSYEETLLPSQPPLLCRNI